MVAVSLPYLFFIWHLNWPRCSLLICLMRTTLLMVLPSMVSRTLNCWLSGVMAAPLCVQSTPSWRSEIFLDFSGNILFHVLPGGQPSWTGTTPSRTLPETPESPAPSVSVAELSVWRRSCRRWRRSPEWPPRRCSLRQSPGRARHSAWGRSRESERKYFSSHYVTCEEA